MIQDQVKVTGALSVVVTNEKGEEVDRRDIKNLVVNAGKAHIAQRLGGSTGAMSHMAIGSGTTAPAAGNTALTTELGRVALTNTTVSGATVTYTATFGPGTGTGAVTEAGIFTAASSGTMLARTTFAVLNKAAGDTISISWAVTIQ